MRKFFRYIIVFTVLTAFQLFRNSSLVVGQCSAVAGILTASDTNLCTNQPVTLILTGHNGTITWQWRLVGTETWNNLSGSDATYTFSISAISNREYRAYVAGDICSVTSNIITLHVSYFADEPSPGFGGDICGYNFALDAIDLAGSWSMTSGPGNAIFTPSANIRNPSVSVNTTGNYEFTWSITNGVCTKDSSIIMNIIQQPVANAGNSMDQCGRSFNLNATFSVTGATGQWFKTSGGTFNILESTNPKSAVTSNTGTFQLRWTETNSVCQDDTIITIRVADQPDANAGINGSECDLTHTLGATPSIYAGSWSLISGPNNVSFSSGNLYNAIATANDFGENYILQWKLTNSFCSDSDTVIINFYEQPVTNAITPDDACGTNAVLKGYKSTGSSEVNRLWSNVSGVSSINNINIINDSVVSVNIQPGSYGNYTFRWKEINGICSDSADVSLTFFEQPVAKAGKDIDSCGSRIRLSAEPSVIGSSTLWSVPGHETNITFSNPASNIATASSDSYLPFLFVWTEINSICTSSDTLAVEFIQVPQAFAGENDSICGFTYELKATQSISNSSGNWTTVAGLDTIFLSNNFATPTNVSSAGTYRYIWAESNKKCISTDNVEVTFFDQPQAEILEAEDACGTNQTITVASVNDNTGNWELISGRGTAFFNPSGVSNKYTLEVSDTGAYIVRWSAFNNMCTDDTTFTISFYAEPEADAGPDIETCGNTIELTSGKSIGTGTWHKISGNGEVVFDYISDTTFIATSDRYGTFILSWQVENGACIIDDRIVAKFFEMPVADAGSDTLICGSAISLNASPANGYWSVLEGSGKLSFSPDTTSATITLNTQSAGIYKLLWSATNDICSDTSSVSIHFLQKPVADAGIDQILNNKFETELLATEPQNSEFGEWALLSGTGDLINGNSAITTVKSLSLGENIFEWSVINSIDHSCRSSDSLFITVYDIFIPEVITPNGDSENDFFVITGIEDISRVEVTVFNRWGIEVFYSADYKNNWGGTNKNGELLTNDTYFYVVDVAGTRIFKGFVVIKK